jgi:restriction endonuclease S subunit
MSQFIEMYYNTHNKQTLESVCPIMNKGITPKYVESSSVLVINQACIHWDGQRLGNIKYHNEEIPVRKRILESGDVLLNATGNGTLGRCCVFICPSDNNTYINDGHVIALSTDRAVILPEVLNTYLSLNDTQAEIYRQYVTGSTNQVDIVFSDIKKMKVPVPSMDEQILFVEVLTQADKSEFVGCKSQFIEMFGDTHMRSDHSRQWKEVVEIINGKDYKSIQVEDGGYPVYGTGGEMARASDYLSPANSILLGRKGTIDKPLLIREKYWNVDTAFGAVPDEKVLHYVYFYWHCKTIDFNVLNKGTTLPSTTKVDLLNLWIKIPSMEEQTRFGSIVEQADKSEFVGCKSQFIEIFYGMETTPVKDYIDDSFPGEWGTEDKDGNGVKVIRTTNFTNSGKLNLADVVTRSIEDRKVVRKQIKKYDTILERSGGTADNPVGRVVLFEEDNLFLCNNFTQVLRFKDVDPRFAFYALYYFYQTNRTAIRSMGSKTTGIQNLNMSKYLEIGIPNASDEDQKAFVTIAEQADKSEYYN